MGGVYAVANPPRRGRVRQRLARGRQARAQAETSSDDMIAAGEYLVSSGYNQPRQARVPGRVQRGAADGRDGDPGGPTCFKAAIVRRAAPGHGALRRLPDGQVTGVPEYGSANESEQFQFHLPILVAVPATSRPGHQVPGQSCLTRRRETTPRVPPECNAEEDGPAAFAGGDHQTTPAQHPVLLWVDREAGQRAGASR